jgi:hypothetical protein
VSSRVEGLDSEVGRCRRTVVSHALSHSVCGLYTEQILVSIAVASALPYNAVRLGVAEH